MNMPFRAETLRGKNAPLQIILCQWDSFNLHESTNHLNCRLHHIYIACRGECEVSPSTPAAISLDGAVMASHSHRGVSKSVGGIFKIDREELP